MKTVIEFFAAALAAMLLAAPLTAQTTTDWARFSRYEEANARVTEAPKAVLLGDSITDSWASMDPDWFEENNFIGRGISGQTTSQILVRMRSDVVALRPKYVVILAGVNDIALNNGHAPSVEAAVGSIKSMCEIAKANGIKPIVCSLLCSTNFRWRPEVTGIYEKILQFNSLLKDYARRNRIKYVDYFSLLAGEDGKIRQEYSLDTVHPTMEGYKKMEEYLIGFIR